METSSLVIEKDTYWVIPGRFMAGKTPVGHNVEATNLALEQLSDAGIDCIVNLMQEDETSVAN